MRVGSVECDALVARHPFLSEIMAAVLPAEDGVTYEDDVDVLEVGPGEVMYPRSMVWRPGDDTPSPFERSGERRRVIACLSDATRVVRTLCLQDYGDAVPWESLTWLREIGRSKTVLPLRLPAHVFVRSSYDPTAEPEKVLWLHDLSLAVVTVWRRSIGESAFARSVMIRFATRPEHGFQFHQRA